MYVYLNVYFKNYVPNIGTYKSMLVTLILQVLELTLLIITRFLYHPKEGWLTMPRKDIKSPMYIRA